LPANELRQEAAPLAFPLHQPGREGSTDPELARVAEAWPDLPAHIKAAVLALVATAR
jgi:hypothetical protein